MFRFVIETQLQRFVPVNTNGSDFVTTQGPASITVQGIFFPFSSKILVMPIFLPINPDININY
jgi:hypothetical protein